MARTPATANTGHITSPSPLPNTYTSDPSLRRVLAWYLSTPNLTRLEPHLTTLGAEAVSSKIRQWSADAERNQPYVKGYNVWGERYDVDRLVTSEGWKRLGAWGAEHGVVALGYEDTYGAERRLAQYAVNYLYSPSSGLASCPISMTDGAALILTQEIARKKLPADHPFQVTLKRLLSRGDEFWTSGQWMTERAGGSDVQNTETWATHSPLPQKTNEKATVEDGEYLMRGFKFFSSATDANIALLLAKTEPHGKLSTFLAPLRRLATDPNGQKREVTNGVRIHRLKNKLGTKELPTAELELHDMRAHLVGDLDKGVQTIAPLLNITRTHTFIGSLAGWRRAISIAKSFARARTTVGEPLWLIPMHLRLMAELEGRHRAAMELSFFTVGVMGVVESGSAGTASQLPHLPNAGKEATVVFRTLTALAKAVVSKMSIHGIQECQEALGGVGYMDEADEPEFNVSRILRNTLVNSIWEGTTNVLASEFVRFLVKAQNLGLFAAWLDRVLGLLAPGDMKDALAAAWGAFKERVSVSSSQPAGILADGRRAMFTLAWILGGVLLVLDAQRDGDGVTGEIARRWVLRGEIGVGDTVWRDIVFPRGEMGARGLDEESIRWDCRIAWGEELPAVAVGHRSMKL
ncbi:putative acyl-CoA dehydrogenase [Aspergillus lucknowensis]|uniref:Acyl-CoA dehydrogenase n=1 Tax=Aspergillus lucknowensis TaxID=176173 RepID=A0ABR4LRR1_9EURO